MFSHLLKEYHSKQQSNKEIQEQRRKQAISSCSQLVNALIDNLNYDVATAYTNQKRIDAETKQLQANVQQFAKQAANWLKLIEELNRSLRELGDVVNWSRHIELEMRTISSSLESAYRAEARLIEMQDQPAPAPVLSPALRTSQQQQQAAQASGTSA